MLTVAFFSFVFGISCAMLGFYHVYLCAINMSTIEGLDRDRAKRRDPKIKLPPNPYDMGVLNNYAQVFGRNPIWWFLPIPHDECDHGLKFPKKEGAETIRHFPIL